MAQVDPRKCWESSWMLLKAPTCCSYSMWIAAKLLMSESYGSYMMWRINVWKSKTLKKRSETGHNKIMNDHFGPLDLLYDKKDFCLWSCMLRNLFYEWLIASMHIIHISCKGLMLLVIKTKQHSKGFCHSNL
jgi:hypothetical protein